MLSLEELAERRQQITRRRQALVEQQEQQARLRQERARAEEVLESLTLFCDRIRSRLADASFNDRQTILQLLIERIIVGEDTLEIRHVIPLSEGPGPSTPSPADVQLRSDGVVPAPLVLSLRKDLIKRRPQSQCAVAHRHQRR